MKLDNSQPWMRNHIIKVRILTSPKLMHNPVMRAYQLEFRAMALEPKKVK